MSFLLGVISLLGILLINDKPVPNHPVSLSWSKELGLTQVPDTTVFTDQEGKFSISIDEQYIGKSLHVYTIFTDTLLGVAYQNIQLQKEGNECVLKVDTKQGFHKVTLNVKKYRSYPKVYNIKLHPININPEIPKEVLSIISQTPTYKASFSERFQRMESMPTANLAELVLIDWFEFNNKTYCLQVLGEKIKRKEIWVQEGKYTVNASYYHQEIGAEIHLKQPKLATKSYTASQAKIYTDTLSKQNRRQGYTIKVDRDMRIDMKMTPLINDEE